MEPCSTKLSALSPLNRASALLSKICHYKFQSPRTGNQMFPRPPSVGSNPTNQPENGHTLEVNVSFLVPGVGFEPTQP